MIRAQNIAGGAVAASLVLVVTLGLVPRAEADDADYRCPALIEGIRARYRGNVTAATDAFRRALLDDGDVAVAHLHLGLVYESSGDLEAARREYRRALDARPGYVCARWYLERLDRSSSAGAPLVAAALTGVSPGEIERNFSRYKGRTVQLEGRLLCWPCATGPVPIILVSTVAEAAARSDAALAGAFVVRLRSPLPDDPRVRTGAHVEVRGKVVDRDFLWHPWLKIMTTERRPVIEPAFISISNPASLDGPLTISGGR